MTKIQNPVIIIGCPRSGTSFTFSILNESAELFSLYRESFIVFAQAYKKNLLDQNANNDCLSYHDLSPELKNYLLERFHNYSFNSNALSKLVADRLMAPSYSTELYVPNPFNDIFAQINGAYKNLSLKNYRLVEKTPRNCFRISFMDKLFPDAKYIYITRDARTNISSLMEGWRRDTDYGTRFPIFQSPFTISNLEFNQWKYVLPPGWEAYNGKSLEEICAFQWIESNRYALDGLAKIDPSRVHRIKYEDLTANTPEVTKGMAEFLDIPYATGLKAIAEKPRVVSTKFNDKPRSDKWKKNEEALKKIYPMIEPMMQRLDYKLANDLSVTNR